MKTILVLTDFSKAAQQAADAALLIAGRLKADILLLNSFITVPIMPSEEGANWHLQDYYLVHHLSEENLENEKRRLGAKLKSSTFEPAKPSINIDSAFGNLVDNVKTIIKKQSVQLVVMGGRDKHDMPLLFGDDIKSVINHINKPVLIVPSQCTIHRIENVIFATDLEGSDLISIKELSKLAGILKFKIHVAHVTEPVLVPDFREEADTADFRRVLAKLKIKGLDYQTLHGEDVTAQLEKYRRSSRADLIAMVHKKHSLLWRMFNEKPCQEMIADHKMPLLVYPEVH